MKKAIWGALITALILNFFLIDFIIAEGNSMEPSIQSGSILIVNRLQYGLRFPGQNRYLIRWSIPRQGDVVVFYAPSGNIAVKRCGELIGETEFLAQGDNSLQSYDSRSYGPVSVDNTIGKVMGVR